MRGKFPSFRSGKLALEKLRRRVPFRGGGRPIDLHRPDFAGVFTRGDAGTPGRSGICALGPSASRRSTSDESK